MDSEITFLPRLVEELNITPRQILAAAQLLDEGNTIPFIARYRKEAHGNLDEVQIGNIQERLLYHREFEARRAAILRSIEEQGKLTADLKAKIEASPSRAALEDLYLPYRPKRRTRAMIAREKGLEPLARLILAQGGENPQTEAAAFISPEKGVETTEAALAGARDIVAETIAEHADLRGFARRTLQDHGLITSQAVEPKPAQPTKFEQYYEFSEPVRTIPSHRFLAIRRGESEGILRSRISADSAPILKKALELFNHNPRSTFAAELEKAAEDSYKRLIAPSVELDAAVELKMKADRSAVEVFAENLRHLLLQPPLGERTVIGIDPGIRTGCKCAALDATGKFLHTLTLYPTGGDRREMEAQVDLCKLISRYHPQAIAIGNGTAGRETETFVRQTLKKAHAEGILVVSVNEAGASVYSASDVAREEFPDLDLTIRGAISIGRRLQDPLAELVKIDPKAIGVGQYQHDVHPPMLAGKLDEVIVSCVNHVGVELNTASAPLLTRVSGIGPTMARKIIAYRNENGAFQSREQLTHVPGLGAKTFEQAAGFLRIHGGKHPLDASAVHPERYPLVEKMAADLGLPLPELIGKTEAIDKIDIRRYISASVGEPTLRDIIAELKKPGRDPRATFEKPAFRDDVTEIAHVQPGMILEGIVTNVTAFGAFVDIGVHQDGLVHISELSDRYITDPSQAVKTGDRLKVRVLTVDLKLKRISLTARSGPPKSPGAPSRPGNTPPPRPGNKGTSFTCNPFGGL